MTIRLLVDRGQLEIFGNNGRVYKSLNVNFDSLPGDDTLALFTDGRVRLERLAVHQLGAIWGGESTLKDNLGGKWYADSGAWSDVSGGKLGKSNGDAFYLNTRSGTDFTYEADVRLESGVAAALTFRADREADRHYTANIDAHAKVVKLWRPAGTSPRTPSMWFWVAPITSRWSRPARGSRSISTAAPRR